MYKFLSFVMLRALIATNIELYIHSNVKLAPCVSKSGNEFITIVPTP